MASIIHSPSVWYPNFWTSFLSIDVFKILSSNLLTLQEGGRVSNLCDNVNKVQSMNRVIRILKNIEDEIKTIAVGDNYNDLDMLKNCDLPCLVFNDQF